MSKVYYTYRIRLANNKHVQVEKWDSQRQSLGQPQSANLGTIWLGTTADIVFSRCRVQWTPARPIALSKNEKLRIALVVSAPSNLGDVEYKRVKEALEKLASEQATQVELLLIVNEANPEAVKENQNEVRNGILCSSIQEISSKIDEIIKIFLKEEPNRILEFVEIYLPYKLLYMNVEKWSILNDFDEEVPILQEYKVVLHATDRVKPGTSYNNLLLGWERLNNILQEELSVDILQHIEFSNNKSDWDAISGKLRRKIGIKLIQPLSEEADDFIKAIIKGGVPLAFWIKCKPNRSLHLNKIDCLLTVEYLENNLDKLIKHVCQIRYDAYNERQNKELADDNLLGEKKEESRTHSSDFGDNIANIKLSWVAW